MRTIYVSVAVALVLMLLATAGFTALAQKIDLGVDLDNAIVLFNGSDLLYKKYDNGSVTQKRGSIYPIVGDDIKQLLNAYPNTYVFYLVVKLHIIDEIDTYPPSIATQIRYNNNVVAWGTSWLPVDDVMVFQVYRQTLEMIAYDVAPKVYIELYNYGLPTSSGDTYYAVSITYVALAPPEAAASTDNTNSSELAAEELAYISADTQGMLLLGLGAVIILVLIIALARR